MRARHRRRPGCITLAIHLGEFGFYTAGDQIDNKWQHGEEPVEQEIVASGAIPGGTDIDVLKVSHHGSDSSSSPDFVAALDPEVAIVSTKYTAGDKLPKRITLKQFQENRCYTLITGDGHKPGTAEYTRSPNVTPEDLGDFSVNPSAVFNDQGDVTVLVSGDGSRYTVVAKGFDKTFSAVNGENRR